MIFLMNSMLLIAQKMLLKMDKDEKGVLFDDSSVTDVPRAVCK